MKAVLLVGGFAKRMGDLTRNRPKALLEVSGKPILNHILERLEQIPEVKDVIISTNAKFEQNFQDWILSQETSKNLRLVIEPTMDEEEKLGSIGALNWLIQNQNIQEDMICIFGDNLFRFDLSQFVSFYKQKESFLCGLHKYPDKSLLAGKLGVVEVDPDSRIIGFEEKPEDPKTTIALTGINILPAKKFQALEKYLEEGHSHDAFGNFITWLHKREPVHGFVFSEKWFDIGTPESYQKAREAMG